MFKKILIANRGEIAVRIIRACRELGIRTVAVYSEVDREARHVRWADEAYLIGPAPAKESYLVAEKIIEVARQSGADAIHPGYGFLSENADFSDLCAKNKIKFIGPRGDSMRMLGDKVAARKVAAKAKVPTVPGMNDPLDSVEQAGKMAEKFGYPVLLKARSGGGGKGMRRVDKPEEIDAAYRLASSEAKSSFNDEALYLEKYVEGPHHIEVQILGDSEGNVVALGERECSVQRRHQKIIEESPSPFVGAATRKKIMEAAVVLARAAKYVNAGTMEFLVDKNQNYYFLEMNARLQVEHAITEQVTGIDLVRAQLRIAAGERLDEIVGADPRVGPKQGEHMGSPLPEGHAIECRIYAEDPDQGFVPSPGKIERLREPSGPWVRIDSAVYPKAEISIYYDPMIAKLITWGPTREEAITRMERALKEYQIMGVKTNIAFHEAVMAHPAFRQGNYDTGFVDHHIDSLKRSVHEGFEEVAAIAAMLFHQQEGSANDVGAGLKPAPTAIGHGEVSSWKSAGRREGIRS